MLATSTALVLALTLGVAPGPVPHVPAPSTEAPSAEAPSTEAPSTEAPSTEAPSTEAPSTEAPSTEAPSAEAPTTEAPTTEDDDPFGDHADEEPWPDDGTEPEPDADAEPLPDYDPLRDSPQALRARHWVRTGIGTLAAGGALLVGAIIMGASDPCYRPAGNSCQAEARNRAALVMGVPAAILVGGGAAMLGLGLTRQRRLAIDLQASRTSLGVTVRGRF